MIMKTLISFDFSASVPAGATITLATLSLYAFAVASGRTITVNSLRRSDWVETEATWNVYKTGSNWGVAGAKSDLTDYMTSYAATSASLSAVGWQNWDVKDQIQYARDNKAGIIHLLIWDAGSSELKYQQYYSREYTNNTSLCPKLYIEYTVPSAIKTVNGLAVASVKTLRSSVVIASGKTWNGVA